MHLSTGSGRRQVCGVFMVSLVKPRLISFLCLLSLCSSGTLRLSGWCHRNIPKIPMAAIHARVRTCRPAQINAGMRTCLVSLNDPALMGVSGLTGGAASPLSSNGEAVLPSDKEAVLPLTSTNPGGGAHSLSVRSYEGGGNAISSCPPPVQGSWRGGIRVVSATL